MGLRPQHVARMTYANGISKRHNAKILHFDKMLANDFVGHDEAIAGSLFSIIDLSHWGMRREVNTQTVVSWLETASCRQAQAEPRTGTCNWWSADQPGACAAAVG